MGLRIQNNIAALNAHRQLTISDRGLSKSLERLSSGYRINRAADDAAGMAISSVFRADIASYTMASRNASEASSLLQVAEGAANQIDAMLTRLKELATQAASANADANTDKINAEKSKLLTEIDKIANSTEYGGTSLIDGTYGVSVLDTGSNVTAGNGYDSITGMKQGYTYEINVEDTNSGVADVIIEAFDDSGSAVATEKLFDQTIPGAGSTQDITFDSLGVTLTVNNNLTETLEGGANDAITASSGGASTFQLGANNASSNQVSISLDGLTQSDLGISGLDLSSASAAQNAMDSIDTAIGTLNDMRGNVGAKMNQLSYHAANLSVTIENVTAAESVIRDVDMAAEMVSFTKYQILQQAGTAMLAQANMAPQSVLSLFGG